MKFLVVDDEDVLRELISGFIETLCPSAEIVEARNGAEAIAELDSQGQDFKTVFCDYRMPEKNGGDVFSHLLKKGLKVPFVLISSDSPDDYPVFSGHKIHSFVKPDILVPLQEYFEGVWHPRQQVPPHAAESNT